MVVTIPGVKQLSARNPGVMTGAGNWTYFLSGSMPALIDAGVGQADHVEELSSALGTSVLARVMVTHAHADHASGALSLAARWPAAVFLKYPWPDQDARYAVQWQPIVDGQQVAAGDLSLEVVHTPGHSPDHVCLWHADTRTLFSGDLLVEGMVPLYNQRPAVAALLPICNLSRASSGSGQPSPTPRMAPSSKTRSPSLRTTGRIAPDASGRSSRRYRAGPAR